jgi:hypothetical protein
MHVVDFCFVIHHLSSNKGSKYMGRIYVDRTVLRWFDHRPPLKVYAIKIKYFSLGRKLSLEDIAKRSYSFMFIEALSS